MQVLGHSLLADFLLDRKMLQFKWAEGASRIPKYQTEE